MINLLSRIGAAGIAILRDPLMQGVGTVLALFVIIFGNSAWLRIGAIVAVFAILLLAYGRSIVSGALAGLSSLISWLGSLHRIIVFAIGVGSGILLLLVGSWLVKAPSAHPSSTPLAMSTSISTLESSPITAAPSISALLPTEAGTANPTTNTPAGIQPTPQSATTIDRTPIIPSNSPGTLLVKGSTVCDSPFYDVLNSNGEVVGSGSGGKATFIPVGIYNVRVEVPIGNPLIKEGIVITDKGTVEVDFSNDLSTLLVKSHPNFKSDLTYSVYQGESRVPQRISPLRVGDTKLCIVAGKYTIHLLDNSIIGVYPGRDRSTIDVEIKGREDFVLEPEQWSEKLGALKTDQKDISIIAKITDLQTNEQVQGQYYFPAWVPVGRYLIETRNQPYIDLKFEIEIKPGQETTLPLPKSQ